IITCTFSRTLIWPSCSSHGPFTYLSTDNFNALNAMVTELGSLVRDMLARMNSNAAPAQSPQATTAAEFTPPIIAVIANGTSIVAPASLRTCFPNIKAVVITAIIMHEFKAADLHKLDPTNWNKEVAYTFNGATNQFEVSNRAAKEYKNPFSVLIPLQHYFNMLGFHLPKSNNVPFIFYKYTAHLIELIADFEWLAVFQYHCVFFNQR
ncbi:hypothetical protein C0995_006692, partial [Termitomyces sp. Mi166